MKSVRPVFTPLFYKSFMLIAAVCVSGISAAQEPNLGLYSLTESNGLSDNRITSIYQDKAGFLWIGTEDGLNRYDGSIFRIFKTNKNPQLSDNFIRCIVEDDERHLWIGTQSGLDEYDPATNAFTAHLFSESHSKTNTCIDILSDDQKTIWIATLDGLLHWIPQQKKFAHYLNPSGLSSDNKINKILIDKRHQFWLATFSGLWRFYPDEARFEKVELTKFHDESNGMIITVTEGNDGALWLGYWGSGLLRYDPATKRTIRIESKQTNIQGITAVGNGRGKVDLWFGNLVKVDEHDSLKSITLSVSSSQENFKAGQLFYSGNGLLYMGTDKGLLIIDLAKQFFHHQVLSQEDITHQEISLSERNNFFYIGGDGNNFLNVYDSSFNSVKAIPISTALLPPEAIRNPSLLSIVNEDSHQTWLCTEEGLISLDEETGNQKLFRIPGGVCDSRTRNFIDNMFIDSRGIHWVFPWRSGIWQFDPGNGQFRKMIDGLSTEAKKLKRLVVMAAVEDRLNNVWFADLDDGLIRFDRTNQKFIKIKLSHQEKYGLSNVIYDSPFVWGVTTGLVFRVNENTSEVQQWNIPEDFNKTVTGFCEDNQNHIWITTRNGLLSFNKSSFQFRRFTVNDGLVSNVMQGTLFCSSNGRMLYADKRYITIFNPDELIIKSPIPVVVITSVSSQNREFERPSKRIDLDYTYNNFTFKWGLLNFRNPLQNRYYCKLEGVDNDWRYVGNTGIAQYASVLPGRYIFHVKGATSQGVMNEPGDFITIIIHPPFWKTWWFFSSLGIIFIGSVYGVYRYQLGEAFKREKMRNKISADLHDEIGSTLSSISIMSDMMARVTRETSTMEVANEINENTILLMQRMDDIVWSINPKNDTLEDLLQRIRQFASNILEARKIEYTIFIHPDVHQLKLTMESRQHVYLILKEAINNLVKYSCCSFASIEVKRDHVWLDLMVSDNGKGFDAEAEHSGNGLSTMRSRAREMKTNLSITSIKGAGTRILLRLKIK